jgi:hypothetical protein
MIRSVFVKEDFIMKKKFLVVAFAAALVMAGCGKSAEVETSNELNLEQIETEVTEEGAAAVEATVEGASTEVAEEAVEEATVSEDTEEAIDDQFKYSVFTDAKPEEVEAFAQKIVDATLAKDWDTIGDMIEYPIGNTELNNICNNKEEFVAYATETGFEEEYFTALSKWQVADLWGNWQGACIDDGSIWFRDINIDNPEFKIVSYLGLYEVEAAN